MAQLSATEQISTVKLRLDRARRSMFARLLLSPVLRWRYGAPIADELLIIPRDLRIGDPTFLDELEAGHFGLAGFVAPLDGKTPFDLDSPNILWSRELHGFGWLRHFRADRSLEADQAAHSLVEHWIKRRDGRQGVAAEPQVIGRRIISWISCAHVLLDDDDQARYDLITGSLADQVIQLSATWRDAPDGYPRLLALTALLYADLCVAGRDNQLADVENLFNAEVGKQILPDGGHVSRNPGVLVELLLDFLPLNQCFKARNRTPPSALQSAIDRMLLMAQFLRIGDGTLARFNGVGPPADDAVATVTAYLPSDVPSLKTAPDSKYARLTGGDSVALIDAGAAPPLAFSGDAHAGCLAFEFSSGTQPIFVNGGAPGICETEWRPASRGTASHNTLSLGAKSSAKLIRNGRLESMIGAIPIRYPAQVTLSISDNGTTVVASHDGYFHLFGLIHTRTLELSSDGATLSGRDDIGVKRQKVRLAKDLPYAVHFHLHSRVTAKIGENTNTVALSIQNGEQWLFTADFGLVSIEDSVYYADLAGPCASEQIVVRGACAGDLSIRWTCKRI